MEKKGGLSGDRKNVGYVVQGHEVRNTDELKPAQQVSQWLMGKAVMISVIIRVTVGTSATHSQMRCSSRFRPVSQT